MKVIFLLSVILLLNTIGCQNDNPQVNTENGATNSKTKNQNMISNQGKSDDIQYDFKFEIGGNAVKINYKLTNNGQKDYLIFNRGDSAKGYRQGSVYAESKDANTVEISQKSFTEPQNAGCPDRLVPIRAGASWLKAGETVEDSVEIAFPLKTFTPFDDCTQIPQISGNEENFQFCLGIAQAEAQTEVAENGAIKSWSTVKPQQILCSELIRLK